MVYIWIALMVILFIVEANTMQMVSIWLAGGALSAAIVAICGLNELWQVGAFVVISVVLLVLTRPLVKTILKNQKREKINFDRIIGEKVIITEEVNNISGKGKTVVSGVEWKVKSASGEDIEKGKIVVVEKIEGTKLIVSE